MSNAPQLNPDRALQMLESGEAADCIIEVVQHEQQQDDDQSKSTELFNVHKYVLILNSDVFRAMFSHKNTKEFRESHIQIKDFPANCVRQMLIYMYTGKLSKEQYDEEKDAASLMKIAHKYQIKSLMDFNEKNLIDSLSLENVIDRLELADAYQIDSLKSSCGRMIRCNLDKLKETAKWLELKIKLPELAFALLEDFPGDKCRHCNCDSRRSRSRSRSQCSFLTHASYRQA